MLYQDYGLTTGMSVDVMCCNHITMALLLPALSRLGVRVKLMNTDIAPNLLKEQVERSKIDVLIYDSELKEQRVPVDLPCNMLHSEYLYQKVVGNAQHLNVKLPRIKRGGDISVFTGGTSGKSKEASRKMNVNQFLPPLFALLEQLRLDERDSVLLPLPVYHGFGLATLVMSLLMGKKVCLMRHFDAEEALKTIANEEIEVVPLVPAMLARLW